MGARLRFCYSSRTVCSANRILVLEPVCFPKRGWHTSSKKKRAYIRRQRLRKQRRKPLFQAVTNAYFGVSSSVLGFRQASCLANTLNVVDMLHPAPVKMLISHIFLNIVHICDIRHHHRTLLVLLALQLLLPSISQANLPGEFVYQNFFLGLSFKALCTKS